MSSAGAWSYSKIKSFENCPKQFYHTNVLKEFPFQDTTATIYGKEFHTACEEYIRDGKPLPPQFSFMEETMQRLAAMPGDKHCELKMGLTADLEPCDFFAKDVWFRGIADLIVIDGETARYVDYKTGKSSKYADTGQLQLMALAVFKHFPQVKKVKGALLFTIANDMVKQDYSVTDEGVLWKPWVQKYAALEKAFETGVWNPRPSGLCKKYCPVTECPHNGV
jgi:ATP-dependent helicase/DNAse subunit B